MLTFLTTELPNFKSFLVLPGVLNENPADINMRLFDQSIAKLNNPKIARYALLCVIHS